VRYTRGGDLSLAYRTLGEGPLDVLVLPGFISHLEIVFEPIARVVFDRLARFARVILFDKRGQGLSDRTGEVYALEEIVDDVELILDEVGSERASVIGMSEGGSQAALFAATRPDRVDKLVLWGTYARLIRADDYPQGIEVAQLRGLVEGMVARWGEPVALKLFAPSVADDPAMRDWWGRLLRSSASPGSIRELFRAYEEIDVREVLPSISAPTLVIYREGDRVSPPEMGAPFVELIPDVQETVLPGTDHLMNVDPDPALDEIERFLTGEAASADPDRVLATVLFTDIVSSTERAASLGDRRWRLLLEEHDRIAREVVERFRGRPIKQLGDGHLVAFDGPARGIRAAAAIRERVRALGISVRSGVHAGECEVLGEDLGGISVHIGARIGALAGPGEVLVSRTVKDLVIGTDLAFEERGVHALKGVPGEWELFALAS
jgi:pimeloyl-ACP methyl ester carboxylesterase